MQGFHTEKPIYNIYLNVLTAEYNEELKILKLGRNGAMIDMGHLNYATS